MFMNNQRRPGGSWLLHLAGIAGIYVLGREAGKQQQKRRSNSGSSWNPFSTTNETVSTPESGHQQ